MNLKREGGTLKFLLRFNILRTMVKQPFKLLTNHSVIHIDIKTHLNPICSLPCLTFTIIPNAFNKMFIIHRENWFQSISCKWLDKRKRKCHILYAYMYAKYKKHILSWPKIMDHVSYKICLRANFWLHVAREARKNVTSSRRR